MKQLLPLLALLSVCLFNSALADDTAPPAKPQAQAPASSDGAAAASAAPAKTVEPAAQPKVSGPQYVQVSTNMGNFVIELNGERAPLTVAHFLKLVDAGHYSNTIFHRVVPNFVVQGGGFDANYNPKHVTEKVVNESGNGLSNVRGSVGMARNSEPHAADAQFYVNLYDNVALDPNQTRWGYAVFGKVVSGMEVVDRIGNVPTGSHGAIKEDTPLKPVIILKIERTQAPAG
ncbi:MAG TPA: peptidylprolyl isomerase [Steroidobacteraceae bacterium]|jgi:cyclophilin family peptidyl-prolyl cis-trans isomerase